VFCIFDRILENHATQVKRANLRKYLVLGVIRENDSVSVPYKQKDEPK
jgi:hypothetical protein